MRLEVRATSCELIIIGALFAFSGLAANAQDVLHRLDPHGPMDFDLKAKVDLKKHKECTTCHTTKGSELSLKPSARTACTNCHGSAPHSGVVEHMGKNHGGQAISCLSCHSPHRAGQIAWEKPLSFFSPAVTPSAPKGFVQSAKSSPMLRKTCSECHKW